MRSCRRDRMCVGVGVYAHVSVCLCCKYSLESSDVHACTLCDRNILVIICRHDLIYAFPFENKIFHTIKDTMFLIFYKYCFLRHK